MPSPSAAGRGVAAELVESRGFRGIHIVTFPESLSHLWGFPGCRLQDGYKEKKFNVSKVLKPGLQAGSEGRTPGHAMQKGKGSLIVAINSNNHLLVYKAVKTPTSYPMLPGVHTVQQRSASCLLQELQHLCLLYLVCGDSHEAPDLRSSSALDTRTNPHKWLWNHN